MEELKITMQEDKQFFKEQVDLVKQDVKENVQVVVDQVKMLDGSAGRVICINDRLHVIAFPAPNVLQLTAKRLNKMFGDNFLLLNLSEKTYDTNLFEGHVMDVEVKGLPMGSLDAVSEMCMSIHRFLKQDEKNVLVVHCFAGFTRSAALLAAYLAWTDSFDSPAKALPFVVERLKDFGIRSVVPSQHRYLGYYQQVLGGTNPQVQPVKIARLILNGVPDFGSVSRWFAEWFRFRYNLFGVTAGR